MTPRQCRVPLGFLGCAELEEALAVALSQIGDDWGAVVPFPVDAGGFLPWNWKHGHPDGTNCSFVRRCLDGEHRLQGSLAVRLLEANVKRPTPEEAALERLASFVLAGGKIELGALPISLVPRPGPIRVWELTLRKGEAEHGHLLEMAETETKGPARFLEFLASAARYFD